MNRGRLSRGSLNCRSCVCLVITIVTIGMGLLGTILWWHFLRQFEEQGLPGGKGLGHFWAAGPEHQSFPSEKSPNSKTKTDFHLRKWRE